ncbi:CAP domain-containing protein [Neobacillus niacini]|uniref:CAP domain-containing protein n=1 Tax=Neobacillus niacini TaxID=86668 RepID=UPI000AC9A725|nr:CAP domain-containing protein [Neobacillus niacini]MEC1520981.1 CAP domain-containing protein [Neobacillus niacini]
MTIGFYASINENDDNEVLITDEHTLEMNESLYQNQENGTQEKTTATRPTSGLGILIGQDLGYLKGILGEPQRIDESLYGYQWYIYNIDYSRYVQVGVENNKVVTVYAVGEDVDVSPFKIGQPIEEIFNTHFIDTNIDIDYNGNSYRFELNDTDLNIRPLLQLGDVFVQLYIDKFTGSLSSVRFLNDLTLIKQRPYELGYTGELIEAEEPTEDAWRLIEEGTEKEILDITNVMRLRHNVKSLEWDQETSDVAYNHSKDMSENNDFSHTSKKFGNLSDRLEAANVAYKSAGENIAVNYPDGPAVAEGWLNSKGHRESLLNEEFTHLGVGVYRKYYTQNFILKNDE